MNNDENYVCISLCIIEIGNHLKFALFLVCYGALNDIICLLTAVFAANALYNAHSLIEPNTESTIEHISGCVCVCVWEPRVSSFGWKCFEFNWASEWISVYLPLMCKIIAHFNWCYSFALETFQLRGLALFRH